MCECISTNLFVDNLIKLITCISFLGIILVFLGLIVYVVLRDSFYK